MPNAPTDTQACAAPAGRERKVHIEVRDLTMAYGSFVVMRDLNFKIHHGDIFVIMGGSGSGKSTILRQMVGLLEPASGEVLYDGESFTRADEAGREAMLRRFGVLYQSGALWSSMTLAENIGLPLGQFTNLKPDEIRAVASFKLALVGLKGFEDYYPSRNQRRHAKARWPRARDRTRSRGAVL